VTDSDTALVARVVANDDRSAFELLVRRHQSPLRNFLRRLAKNDAARADDLAQETFIKAYRSMASFAGTAKFSSWLYRIALQHVPERSAHARSARCARRITTRSYRQ
jgi:RNA polymerase sigma factor (sigma-70 family)